MRAEVTLPLGAVGLTGLLAASFNHGLSNGSTFYLHKTMRTTIISILHVRTTKMLITDGHVVQHMLNFGQLLP